MNETPRCPHCGKPLPNAAVHCPMCGAGPPRGVSTAPGVMEIVLMVVLGIVCAVPIWILLSIVGASLFAKIGPPSVGPGNEFGVSVGATIFFIFVTLLTIAGLIVQARIRMSALTRAFALAFLCTVLGFFTLCDIFGISSHG